MRLPVAEAAARLRSGAGAADLLATLPQVHVAEAGGGTANITLDRGAVIAGKLQWDDGTPATGVNVSAQSTTSAVGAPTDLTRVVSQLGGGFGGGFGGFQMSDDRGYFRVTGLAPGSYWVRATMMTPAADPGSGTVQRMSSVVMYAPGKVRRTDAETVTLKSGEERDDLHLCWTFRRCIRGFGTCGRDGPGERRGGDGEADGFTGLEPDADGDDPAGWKLCCAVGSGRGLYTLAVSNASNVPSPGFGRRGQNSSGGGTSHCAVPGEPDGDGYGCERGGRNADHRATGSSSQ